MVQLTTNLLLMKESKEISELSRKLGFDKCLFLDKDFVLAEGESRKEILKAINEGKKRNLLIIVKPRNEELLRFVLEKTEADMVFGQELINPEDSVHFRRGGLDQIICKIAAEKKKIIGFSFREMLQSEGEERSKLLGRMMFNTRLCRRYGAKFFFGNFSESKWEMRGAHDLRAWGEILGAAKGFLEF